MLIVSPSRRGPRHDWHTNPPDNGTVGTFPLGSISELCKTTREKDSIEALDRPGVSGNVYKHII